MGSGGGGGGDPSALQRTAAPAPGLPISGKDSTIGDPYEYGKFQSFLPDIPNDGSAAPSAHGLQNDMFMYKSPSGVVAQSDQSGQINDLRDALAKLQDASKKRDQFGAGAEPSFSGYMPATS